MALVGHISLDRHEHNAVFLVARFARVWGLRRWCVPVCPLVPLFSVEATVVAERVCILYRCCTRTARDLFVQCPVQ